MGRYLSGVGELLLDCTLLLAELALEQGHLLPPRGRGGVQPLDGILLRLLCVAEPLLELARRHEEEVR